MTRARMLIHLAKWEFMRSFKLRDFLISIGITVVLLIVMAVVGNFIVAAQENAEARRLGVVGETPFALPESTDEFEWVEDAPRTLEELDAAMADGMIDGYLDFESSARATVVSESGGAWIEALRSSLSAARRDARVRAHGLEQEALDDILTTFELERVTTTETVDEAGETETERKTVSKAQNVIAIACVSLMFIGIMTGTSYLFIGITSEKQARVTEQIVAAVPPQSWIDGKILGAAARSSLTVTMMGIQAILGIVVWQLAVTQSSSSLGGVFDFGQIAVFALLALLGFGLWYCFFAAVAATINDPNTSSRGAFLFMPFLSIILAVPVYLNPVGPVAVVLGIVPITSPVALPMRMVLADVAWWEIVSAVIALIISIWFIRRAAGRVFALGIMMHGKEPTWREMAGAMRRRA